MVYEPAAGTFVFLKQTTPLYFLGMYLMDVVNLHRFYGPSKHPLVHEPAAGTFFLRKTCPWNLGACILWILSMFIDFKVPGGTGAE